MPEKKMPLVGIPEAQAGLSTSNGAHPQYSTVSPDQILSISDEVERLAAGSFRTREQLEAEQRLSAAKVGDLLSVVLTWPDEPKQQTLSKLKDLVGLLSREERREHAITSHLYKELKTHEAVEAWLDACGEPPGQPVFKPMGLGGLLSRPRKQWLIDNVIGAGDLGMIYGSPGSGKTFVTVDMVFAACLGQEFARRFFTNKQMSVAYCAGEGVSGLPQRFAAAAEYYGVDDLPNFTFFDVIPQLYTDDQAGAEIASMQNFITEQLARQAAGQAHQLDLLILDTLHAATEGADENSAKDMGKVLHLLRHASRALGCAVLLVHHSNKAGTGERGSSSLRGAMDTMLEVKPISNKFMLCCEKLKDGEQWKSQTFSLVEKADSVRVWWDEPADESNKKNEKSDRLLAELKRYAGKRFTAKSLAEIVGGSQSAATNALSRLEQTGEIMRALQDPDKESSNRNPWVYYYEKPDH